MKRAIAINDISGIGRCSLVADISVLSAMGIHVCPVPTGIYTMQTGFPEFLSKDNTDMLADFKTGWTSLGLRFCGILTGYLQDADQAEKVLEFVQAFKEPDTVLLTDPVLADNGAAYPNHTAALEGSIRKLVNLADIITPNLSELCLLAGTDLDFALAKGEAGERLSETARRARLVIGESPKTIVVTGLKAQDEERGKRLIGNAIVTKDTCEAVWNEVQGEGSGGSYSGTGDLMAAILLGGALKGLSTKDSAELAGRFIGKAVKDAYQRGVDPRQGVDYEAHLGMLHR